MVTTSEYIAMFLSVKVFLLCIADEAPLSKSRPDGSQGKPGEGDAASRAASGAGRAASGDGSQRRSVGKKRRHFPSGAGSIGCGLRLKETLSAVNVFQRRRMIHGAETPSRSAARCAEQQPAAPAAAYVRLTPTYDWWTPSPTYDLATQSLQPAAPSSSQRRQQRRAAARGADKGRRALSGSGAHLRRPLLSNSEEQRATMK